MKSFKPFVLPALALLLTCSTAGAQAVYRCGNSYSQSPCANAVAVQTDDPRTEAQRDAAREGLAHDKALAKEMEATRRKDEAQALALDKAALARAAAAHKKQDKKTVAGKKPGSTKPRTVKVQDPDVFTASDGAFSSKKKTTGKSAKP
jgi:hypothetical protein